MAGVKVFGLPATAETARVLTCLFEKNVEFQLIRTDTYKAEGYKVPDFVMRQDPNGQVIYKEGEKKTLVDSRDICRHICRKYYNQGHQLLGSGDLERASIEAWLQTESQKFDPPSTALVLHLAFSPIICLRPDHDLVDENEGKLARVLDAYEEKLEQMEYLAGDDFTLADLSHLPNSHYLVHKTQRGHDMFFREEEREEVVGGDLVSTLMEEGRGTAEGTSWCLALVPSNSD